MNGGTPDQQFVQQAAGGVDVAAVVDGLAAGLLGREVLRRADHGCGLRHRRRGVGDGAGDAEVHHLHDAPGGEHDVGGLDVAVHDAGLVAVAEGFEHALGELQGLGRHDLASGAEQFAQGVALDELHHDEGHHHAGVGVGLFAGVVDGDDVGVVQACGRLGLPPETGLEGRVGREVDAQLLDGHVAAQSKVTRTAHFGHAATADHRAQLVATPEKPRLFGHPQFPFRLLIRRTVAAAQLPHCGRRRRKTR